MEQNLWTQLKEITSVALDSFNPQDYHFFTPEHGTCNPSIVRQYMIHANHHLASSGTAELALVHGAEAIFKELHGKLAIQLNPFFAHSQTQMTCNAKHLLHLFGEAGIESERVILKIPGTWEGILAAKELEEEGITTMLTAVFTATQAMTAMEKGISYIAPWVSAIQSIQSKDSLPLSHKGVELTLNLHQEFKQKQAKTRILAAGLKTIEEAFSVASIDALTIKPRLALELQATHEVPTLYRSFDLNLCDAVTTKRAFESQIKQEGSALEYLEQSLNQFRLSWMAIKQLASQGSSLALT